MTVTSRRRPTVYDVRNYGAVTLGTSPSAGERTANTSAVQGAIDAAEAVDGGTVLISYAGEVAVNALTVDNPSITIQGLQRETTLLSTNSGDLLTLGPGGTSRAYYFKAEDISYRSRTGGGHIFACTTNLSHARFQDIACIQDNTDKSIYYHVGQDYIDGLWDHCNITISNSATVAAFHIRSNAPSRNRWSDCRVNGAGYYIWDIETTSASGYANDNVIENITGEFNNGGFARIAGARGCVFRNIGFYDMLTQGNITRTLISLEAATSGPKSGNCLFDSVKRHGGTLDASVYDIAVSGAATAFFTFLNCGTVSAGGFEVDLNGLRAVSIESPYVTWTDAEALVRVHSESGIEGIVAPIGRFTKGYQATPASRTATLLGDGNGLIADHTRNVAITTPGVNAIITLPTPYVGYEVTIYNTSLIGYELRTNSPTTIAINGGTGADAESAIPSGTTVHCRGTSATTYVCINIAADGTVTSTEVAAP